MKKDARCNRNTNGDPLEVSGSALLSGLSLLIVAHRRSGGLRAVRRGRPRRTRPAGAGPSGVTSGMGVVRASRRGALGKAFQAVEEQEPGEGDQEDPEVEQRGDRDDVLQCVADRLRRAREVFLSEVVCVLASTDPEVTRRSSAVCPSTNCLRDGQRRFDSVPGPTERRRLHDD